MKRNYQLVFVLLLFFPVFLSSCSGDSDDSQLLYLVPLSIGNVWEYELEDKSIRKDSIESREVIENQHVYFLETDYDTWKELKAIYNTKQGYYETKYFNIDLNDAMYYFKYPVEVGDTWQNTYLFDRGWTDEYEVISLNEKIEVPAGDFVCYLYKVQREGDTKEINYYYFKPGIGLIAIKNVEADSNGNSEKWIKKLYSYSLVE